MPLRLRRCSTICRVTASSHQASWCTGGGGPPGAVYFACGVCKTWLFGHLRFESLSSSAQGAHAKHWWGTRLGVHWQAWFQQAAGGGQRMQGSGHVTRTALAGLKDERKSHLQADKLLQQLIPALQHGVGGQSLLQLH